jgi:Zn-dependent protease
MLYVDKTGLMLPTAMAIILHEAGHIIGLWVFKSKPERINLRVGAVGISGRFWLNSKQEIVMLFMGPFLNILLFICLFSVFAVLKQVFCLKLAFVMLVVGIFNLLPIIGLDGGDILKIILTGRIKNKTVNHILYLVSIITIFVIVVCGFFVLLDTKSNISLILMGIYLLFGILLSKKQKNYCKLQRNIVK